VRSDADVKGMESYTCPEGYAQVKLLHRGQGHSVFQARRQRDDLPVALKVFEATREAMERASSEFEALRSCARAGVPEVFELCRHCERPYLVMERLHGTPVQGWIEGCGPAAVGLALRLAVAWAEIVQAIHAARLLHGNLNPHHLLVDVSSAETYLTGFGMARPIGVDADAGRARAASLGSLARLRYISPEQTDRKARACGVQSDLYSLGASIYYVLTGQPPFPLADPLELIHAHLARVPTAPIELRPDVPDPLSRLVQKLLAKQPEDRYATASSLLADLRALDQEYCDRGEIDASFQLERTQVPDGPSFPSRLYDRERELDALWSSFQRAAVGQPRVVWIRGASGAGKSALVDAIRGRVSEIGGYLVQGCCERSQSHAYGAWIACLESLVHQVLVGGDARIASWRRELEEALGSLAPALCEIVPDLTYIIGEVAQPTPVGARETRARLLLALQRLLSAAATPEHPIAVFLDDFQNADSGSRFLMQELFSEKSSGAFVVILAHEEQIEGDQSASLFELHRRLVGLEVPLDPIDVGAIGSEALLDWLHEVLERPREVVAPLAVLVERKTGGNPLWVRQLLDHLYARQLLEFELGTGWRWDSEEISRVDVRDGATPLLIAKLETLDSRHLTLLRWASCCGTIFTSHMLAGLSGCDVTVAERSLIDLESLGFLVPIEAGFSFAHGRIREAAADALSIEERCSFHARVGDWLSAHAGAVPANQVALEVVPHLIAAQAAWPAGRETERIQICATAGQRALQTGAFQEAHEYFGFACERFDSRLWESERELGLRTFLAGAQSALLAGASEAALELLDRAQGHAISELEIAQLEMHRLQVFAVIRTASECVRHALSVLKRFGLSWPLHPTAVRTYLELMRCKKCAVVRARLGSSVPGDELSAKRAAILMIINAVGGAMVRLDFRLAVLATCYVLRQPLPGRLSTREAYSVGMYALWLQLIRPDPKLTIELAERAERWIADSKDDMYGVRLMATLRGALRPFLMSRRAAIAEISELAERSRELGDAEFAYYSRFHRVYFGALAGDPVQSAHEALAALVEMVERAGHRFNESHRCLEAWRELHVRPSDLDDPHPMPTLAGEGAPGRSAPLETWSSTLWAMVLCVLGRHADVWFVSQSLGESLDRQSPYVHVTHHFLYRGIAAAELARVEARSRPYVNSLERALRRLRGWARFGPDFGHMELLLRAERARLRGKCDAANGLYEQAARGALEQEFPHHAALARERRAALLVELHRTTEARRVLEQATELYERWGAVAKVAQLRARLSS